MMEAGVAFRYGGRHLKFRGRDANDSIIQIMRRSGTFYEIDVLERLRECLRVRHAAGVAIDAGAFVGTHSAYFGTFCGCTRVIGFESHPDNLGLLEENIRLNGLEETVHVVGKAVGSRVGRATVVPPELNNQGTAAIDYSAKTGGQEVEVTTIDREMRNYPEELQNIVLLKIDVEGAELEVLSGAAAVVTKHLPTMCIEIHSALRLLKVLFKLRHLEYCIVDCLGYSPTYIVEPTRVSFRRRTTTNLLWVLRAIIPQGWWRARTYLRRVAVALTGKTILAGRPATD